MHPLEGHGVPIAELTSNHYAVDRLHAFRGILEDLPPLGDIRQDKGPSPEGSIVADLRGDALHRVRGHPGRGQAARFRPEVSGLLGQAVGLQTLRKGTGLTVSPSRATSTPSPRSNTAWTSGSGVPGRGSWCTWRGSSYSRPTAPSRTTA